MKSLMLLWREVLDELGTWCDTSTIRDYKTATERVEHEGLSFLTITLPTFAKDLQKGLDAGKVDRHLFSSFRRKGELPRFLGGFLDLVFDRSTGLLLDEPDHTAIFAMRQITMVFGKILLECSDERKREAANQYIKTEAEVREADVRLGYSRNTGSTGAEVRRDFRRVSSLLFGTVLQTVNNAVQEGNIVPKHGPGTTADRLEGNFKYLQHEWTERLEHHFPYWENAWPVWAYRNDLVANDHLERVTWLDPGAERPVRVVFVPKTLKTPRVIAIEPTATQYVQQGIAEQLVGGIEGHDYLSTLIGFHDQGLNQVMAWKGSQLPRLNTQTNRVEGALATLDLSEASDRVSNQHVRELLHFYPFLMEGVEACRSRKADVPGHGVVRLAKFASMGSALTFPLEAMVFLTVAFMGIEKALNKPFTTSRQFRRFCGSVRVYGDDIIVPVDYVDSVMETLELFGFKVNKDKSFWTGRFRESCGKDYYDGTDVTPVRVRRVLPSSRRSVPEIISLVSTRNQFYRVGMWRTAKYLDELIGQDRLLGRHYPIVEETSPILGRMSVFSPQAEAVHPGLHVPLVKGYVIQTRLPSSRIDGEAALMKFFLKRGDEPFFDERHLERSGRPESLRIKLRQATPY